MQTPAAAPATPDSSTNFAANPDLLANMSDDQLDALAGNANDNAAAATAKVEQGDTDASATPGADGKPTEKPVETPPGSPAEPAKAGAAEPEKEVLAQDGKHTIPYSVLERERNRAVQAEATAAALAEEVKQLQAGKKPDAESAATALTAEELEQLNDLPVVAKAHNVQMAAIEQLTSAVKSIKAGQDVQERSAEQVQIDAEEAAIMANPELVALRTAMAAKDPKATARWNTVVDAYSALSNDPDLVGLPTADLINRAAQGVKTLYGGNLLPAGTAVPQTPAASPAEPTAAELQAKADAALAAAEKSGAAAPRSLGDIPGGSAPATDEAAAMLGKSGAQLTAEFMTMTPDQIEAKLNRLR